MPLVSRERRQAVNDGRYPRGQATWFPGPRDLAVSLATWKGTGTVIQFQ